MNNKLQLTSHEPRATNHESRKRVGSALILTVVLMTLLAIIGVIFLLASRIDKMAASAASESRELNLAVDTVVAKIKQELVLDVPGVPGPGGKMPEYYDYPGPEDRWLASLEPNGNAMWQQISDVTGYLKYRRWPTRNILITNSAPPLLRAVIEDYTPIALDPNGSFSLLEQLTDADGDGVADSKWIELTDITSSKGRPIYAAVRIVDNGGMLNVNTAYKFNPNATDPNLIDGSSQLQINLMALANRPGRPITPPGKDEVALLAERADYRFGNNIADLPKYEIGLAAYEPNVIWRYGSPVGAYTPFDVGDELELRYRFLVNHEDIRNRIERIWTWSFNSPTELNTPIRSGGDKNITDWFKRAYDNDSGSIDPNYSYRHIATTCNMDRIINPDGAKMVNVNMADANSIYDVIRKILPGTLAAQIAVNIKDYRDSDSNVTTYGGYYGFETPCIISEIAHYFTQIDATIYRSYALELYKPYSGDSSPVGWRLLVGGVPISIDNWSNSRQFYVIRNQDNNASFDNILGADVKDSSSLTFTNGTEIQLQRPVAGGGYVTVDSVVVPAVWPPSGWLVVFTGGAIGEGRRSIERDITLHKCIRGLWADRRQAGAPTLGAANSYVDTTRTEMVQAHLANKPFRNIGEIGMVFCTSGYNVPVGSTEADLRLDLKNPLFANIFNYLTVIDPADHGQPPYETRIKGRININTAPWFVIAQLPWMQPQIARAIVGYRDTAAKGFRSIGELMNVAEMGFYTYDNIDLNGFPDLTPNDGDGIQGNFEERDVIFARISNLVTVRSDVFTAYILVRIGANGPQRRVVAILDRSNVYSQNDKVKIIALQPVPDPR